MEASHFTVVKMALPVVLIQTMYHKAHVPSLVQKVGTSVRYGVSSLYRTIESLILYQCESCIGVTIGLVLIIS